MFAGKFMRGIFKDLPRHRIELYAIHTTQVRKLAQISHELVFDGAAQVDASDEVRAAINIAADHVVQVPKSIREAQQVVTC